jgi:threonylcarbamoyladenosine tRNA methylthiotransferase MtaB
MTPPVQDIIKKERVKKLSQCTKKTSHIFSKNFYNQYREVLFEQKKSGYWFGYTPEYYKIKFKSNKNLHNQILSIKLTNKNIIVD